MIFLGVFALLLVMGLGGALVWRAHHCAYHTEQRVHTGDLTGPVEKLYKRSDAENRCKRAVPE